MVGSSVVLTRVFFFCQRSLLHLSNRRNPSLVGQLDGSYIAVSAYVTLIRTIAPGGYIMCIVAEACARTRSTTPRFPPQSGNCRSYVFCTLLGNWFGPSFCLCPFVNESPPISHVRVLSFSNLESSHLQGTIPDFIAKLTQLKFLSVCIPIPLCADCTQMGSRSPCARSPVCIAN